VVPYAENNLGHHVGDDPHAVDANRAASVGAMHADRAVFMRQVHGSDVAFVDARTLGDIDGVDALVTDVPGVALGVLVADCVPVILQAQRAVGVAHAGRRGVRDGVVGRAVAALRQLDDGPLTAQVGPAICGACYEVPGPLQDEVAGAVPGTRSTTSKGTTGLDLRAGVVAQLRAAGVLDIRHHLACTAEDPAYYSYRRDGVTGRFAGIVVLDP
jgi:YfiH family protein